MPKLINRVGKTYGNLHVIGKGFTYEEWKRDWSSDKELE